jgi:hypothetical protein
VSELAVATLETELGSALGLGQRALSWVEQQGRPLLVGASCVAEALVLGALQRADTLPQRSPASFNGAVLHRCSTGTEAQLSGAVLYHALALPKVDALFPDASARTLLNRNLRALLRGYTAVGVPLRYFGTEVLALVGHPVALVGYDQTASGAVLIEVLIGLEAPCVVRSALKRAAPAALFSVLRSSPVPNELLQRAVRGTLERLGATPVDVAGSLPVAALSTPPVDVTASVPAPTAAIAVPIGVVEAAARPTARITGDLLVSTAALQRVEALAAGALASGAALDDRVLAPLQGAPLDGARPADVLSALQQAAASS